jgi:hypothetical protein
MSQLLERIKKSPLVPAEPSPADAVPPWDVDAAWEAPSENPLRAGDEDEEAEEEKPKKARSKGKATDDEADSDTPKKGKDGGGGRGGGKGKDGDPDQDGNEPPKKGSPMKMILIAVGGVALLSCCCCGGVGGYFGYSIYTRPAFVGKAYQGPPEAIVPMYFVGFESNNTGYFYTFVDMLGAKKDDNDIGKKPNLKWKAIDDKTVEITLDDSTKKLWTNASSSKFTYVVSGDDLTLTNTADSKTTKFKKIPPK